MTSDSSNQTLRMIRQLDASPERVFDALVNPETMRKWMFTEGETKFAIDLRVGGKWSITNRRDGTDYVASGSDPPPPNPLPSIARAYDDFDRLERETSRLPEDRKSTRLNSSHPQLSRMPSSA